MMTTITIIIIIIINIDIPTFLFWEGDVSPALQAFFMSTSVTDTQPG